MHFNSVAARGTKPDSIAAVCNGPCNWILAYGEGPWCYAIRCLGTNTLAAYKHNGSSRSTAVHAAGGSDFAGGKPQSLDRMTAYRPTHIKKELKAPLSHSHVVIWPYGK
mmetsp:Transcript_104111/g.176106  ORF Transcript_104111/g.176106 Transcript_104111/m.176106 type:complete len:109 (+) Transcript_104111:278-604(+)